MIPNSDGEVIEWPCLSRLTSAEKRRLCSIFHRWPPFWRIGKAVLKGFVCQCLSITVRAHVRWHGCGDTNLACPSLTALFSRICQAFPRAVREALHHAQEYAEALREPGELLRLRPTRCQHRGLLRRPGELPQPLHGEYSCTANCSVKAWELFSVHSELLKIVYYISLSIWCVSIFL